MTTQREQLRSRLRRDLFPDDAYDVDGAPLDRGHALVQEEGWWKVRVVDEERAHTLGSFEREADACAAMEAALRAAWPAPLRLRARVDDLVARLDAERDAPAIVESRGPVVERLRAMLRDVEAFYRKL